MTQGKRTAVIILVSLLLSVLPACSGLESNTEAVEDANGQTGDLVIRNVMANMTLPTETGSFWMEITNNSDVDDALTGAEVEGCGTIELHDMFMEGDTMVMREVEGGEIPIPAGETVLLERGGLHIMCIGKERPLETGTSLDLVLQFANAGTIIVTGTVVEPGDMPMQEGNMDMGGQE